MECHFQNMTKIQLTLHGKGCRRLRARTHHTRITHLRQKLNQSQNEFAFVVSFFNREGADPPWDIDRFKFCLESGTKEMPLAGSQTPHGLGSDSGLHKAAPNLSSKSQRSSLEPSCAHPKDISAGMQHPKAACLLLDYPPALWPPLEGTESWPPLFAFCVWEHCVFRGCCLELSRIPIEPSLHLTLWTFLALLVLREGSTSPYHLSLLPPTPSGCWAMPEFSPATYWGSSTRGSTRWRCTGTRRSKSHVNTHRTLEISFSEEHTCQEGLFFESRGVAPVSLMHWAPQDCWNASQLPAWC